MIKRVKIKLIKSKNRAIYLTRYLVYFVRLFVWKIKHKPKWKKTAKISAITALCLIISFAGFLGIKKIISIPRAPKIKIADSDSPYLYTAKAKGFEVSLGDKKTNTPKIEFRVSENKITFTPASGREKINEPTIEGKTLTFREVYPKVDYQYETTPKGIKEEIIIKQPTIIKQFPFYLEFEGVTPKYIAENLAGGVFYDEENNYLFHFEKPFAYDSAGAQTEDVQLLVKRDIETKKYVVIIGLDPTWANSPERKYPIYLDPTVVHDETSEFATGQFNRIKDTGSGSSPNLETYYQELPADEHTVGLWHINETTNNTCSGGEDACDSSGNGNHGTENGTVAIETTNQMLGDAARSFDGTDDFISVVDSSTLDLSPAITLEGWVYLNDCTGTGDGRQTLVTKKSSYYLNFVTCKPSFYWYGLSTPGYHTANTAIPLTTWTHVAATYDGYSVKIYINGELDKNVSGITGTGTITALPVVIGGSDTDDRNLDGYIDEVRISSIARTPEEIKLNAQRRPYSIYTSDSINLGSNIYSLDSLEWTELGVTTGDGETVSDSTNLVAQWNFNETSGTSANNDAEGTSCGGTPANCDGTLTGFSNTTGQDVAAGSGWTSDNRKWGAGSLMFNGSSDYIDFGLHKFGPLLNEASQTTIEYWLRVNSFPTTGNEYQVVAIVNSTGGAIDTKIDENGKVKIGGRSTSSDSFQNATSNKALEVGKWHLITGVYDYPNDTIKIYIDGKLDITQSVTFGATTYTDSAHGSLNDQIGNFESTSRYLKGIMDSSRLYTRALSENEILANYNAGQIEFQTRSSADGSTWEAWKPTTNETQIDNFDVDTTPTDISNLRLWLDANDISTITKDGSNNVSQWNDKSGNNYHVTQGTASQQPNYTTGVLNSKPVIRFTASTSDTMTNATDFGTACTVIYVSKQTGGTNARMLSGLTNNWLLGYHGGTKRDAYFEGWVYNATSASDTNWHIYSATIGGTGVSSSIYENGSLVASSTNGVDCPNGISLNGIQGVSEFSDGDIAEVIAYDRMLTRDEIWQLENYLANKYALEIESPYRTTYDSVIKQEGTYSEKLSTGQPDPDPNTVALWHLDETGGTGAYLKDSSGNANHGTPTGTSSINGISSKGRSFNGTSDWIQAGGDLGISGAMTISFWFITPDKNVEYFFDNREPGTWWFIKNYNGGTCGTISGNICFEDRVMAQDSDWNINEWTHIAVTDDTITAKMYINGKLVDTGTGEATTISTNLRYGTRYTNSSYFEGSIDEVIVSNIARTAEEIAESYRMGRDHYINRTISSTDLSSKTSLTFYIAADRPGSYLSTTIGESPYANYQPDANTVGLWHMSGIIDYGHNLINSDTWTIGQGSVLGFTVNGNDAENQRISAADPFGHQAVVWEAQPDAISGPDGGWNGSTFNIDNTKMYRFSVWVKRPVQGNGHFYLGTHGYGSVDGVLNRSDGSNNTNPYFTVNGNWGEWGDNSSWYLAVGHVWPAGSGTGSNYSDGGIYDTNGNLIYTADLADFVWRSETTSSNHRSYLYYSTDTSTRQRWVYPRVDLIDGSEPSIQDLIDYANNARPKILDSSGNNNEGIVYGATSTKGKIGKARSFNGTNDNINLGNPSSLQITGNLTVEAWIKTTQTTSRMIYGKWDDAGVNERAILFGIDNGGQIRFVLDSTGDYTTTVNTYSNFAVNDGEWHHVAGVYDGSTADVYVDGQLAGSENYNSGIYNTPTNAEIGSMSDQSEWYFSGLIDEVRVSNSARSADELRQAHEVGLRSHLITIDFAASLDSGNLITGSGDTSFTVDATSYGLGSMGSNLYKEDKIIVKENVNGIEYIAQGDVTAITTSTGAVTVDAWDAGSTFPTSGYTVNASVFKWQREYWDITKPLASQVNAITKLTLRVTNGNEGRTIWLDDLKSSGDYLTTPGGSTISSTVNRYFQYRAILSSSDTLVSPSLTSVTLNYTENFAPGASTINASYLHDKLKTADATPEIRFTATDPETDDLSYQVQWDTDSSFPSPSSAVSDTDPGFSNITTPVNNDPFNSGDTVSYIFQSALTTDTTYFYKIRAKDPGGSNTYGNFSSIKSFTINTSLTGGNTWFETHTDQFTTDTLTGDAQVNNSGNYIEVSATTGTVTSTAIIAANINPSASTWGHMAFTDDETFGNIKYKVYYDVTGTPTIIPDVDLPGNSTGFDTSPIDLSGLSTTTYSILYAYANLTYSGGSPQLQDWTISFNLKPNLPTLNSPSNDALTSTTPDLKLTATDPDSDNLKYKIELDTVDTFDSGDFQTFDQTSSQAGWSGQDAETETAYASGTQATYTIQSVLTKGQTYYWKGYAIDENGSAVWSTYSSTGNFDISQNPTAPTNLLTEGLTNPTNVSDSTPEFSALCNDPDTGQILNKYQIQVDDDSDFLSTLWDSGSSGTSMTDCTAGNQSQDIPYGENAFVLDGSTYYWRIKFWDDVNSEGAWSAEDATFAMGTHLTPSTCTIQESLDDSSLTLSWTDNSTIETQYRIERNVSAAGFLFLINKIADSESHEDTDVSQGNTYQYRVRAENGTNTNWCTTSTLTLGAGTFEFSGLNFQGINIQ